MFIIIVNEKGSIELRIDFSKIKGQMTSFISFKARKLASHSIPEVIDFFFLKSIRLRYRFSYFLNWFENSLGENDIF